MCVFRLNLWPMQISASVALLFHFILIGYSRRVLDSIGSSQRYPELQEINGDRNLNSVDDLRVFLLARNPASPFVRYSRLPFSQQLPQRLRHSPDIEMVKKIYDVAVVGGGPVGINAALKASSLGKKAVLVDGTPPQQYQFTGPTGLFSKALRESSQRIDVKVLREMGIGDVAIWAQVNEMIKSILSQSGRDNSVGLMRARVPVLRGFGQLADANEDICTLNITFRNSKKVGAGGENILCRKVLLATGSKAVRLACLGCLYEQQKSQTLRVFDSDSIKQLSFLPRNVAIVGGGIIAIEFARIFAEMSAKVTMIIRAKDIPSSLERVGIDREIGLELQQDLRRAGVRLFFETEVESAEYSVEEELRQTASREFKEKREQIIVKVSKKDGNVLNIPTDLLFTATGRSAVSKNLGLVEIAGEDALSRNGDVSTGPDLQTLAPGVYAAGDLIGAPQLASTGIAQAEAAILSMFESANGKGASPEELLSDYTRFPVGVWTIPEVAFVGLTVEKAQERGLSVVEGKARYADTIRGRVHSSQDKRAGTKMLKLVVDRHWPYVIVGVHIFGDDACELIQYGTTLVQDRKTLSDVLALINTAVTYHELFSLAARNSLEVVERLEWMHIYDVAMDGSPVPSLAPEVVQKRLVAAGANENRAERIAALFLKRRYRAVDDFIKFAVRQESPLDVFPRLEDA